LEHKIAAFTLAMHFADCPSASNLARPNPPFASLKSTASKSINTIMKKILFLVAPLLLAPFLHAGGPPGCYLTATFSLKATEGLAPRHTSSSTTYSVRQVALNNTVILELLRQKGVLGSDQTSIKGWKLVAAYAADADYYTDIIGFYALKTQKTGDIAIKIDNYIYFPKPPDTPSKRPDGFIPAYKGKANNKSVSISMKGLTFFFIDGIRNFTVDGDPVSECFFAGLREESMKIATTKSHYELFITSSVKMTLYGQDDGWNFLEGKVTLGSPVLVDDIHSIFPK
jgi:hypothetical protein